MCLEFHGRLSFCLCIWGSGHPGNSVYCLIFSRFPYPSRPLFQQVPGLLSPFTALVSHVRILWTFRCFSFYYHVSYYIGNLPILDDMFESAKQTGMTILDHYIGAHFSFSEKYLLPRNRFLCFELPAPIQVNVN